MTNYNLSITDLSEIRFLTGDIKARENPAEMLKERGFLTEKGNPSVSAIEGLSDRLSGSFLHRLSSKLKIRENGFERIKNTYLKMYSEKDYTGMYLFTAMIYGFVGWRTPLDLNLISFRRELLKIYFGEFVRTLEDFKPERSAEYEDESE